jgi:uncharacterized protein YbbC (DUF1343 family)
MFFRFE